MTNLKVPTTAVLLEKPKLLREDRFIVTYGYSSSGFTDADNSKKQELAEVTVADLCMPVQCSWTKVTIRFPE